MPSSSTARSSGSSTGITGALSAPTTPRGLLEAAAMSLLDYVEGSRDGFRILVRDSPAGQSTGSFASLISDVASQVEHLLAAEFTERGSTPGLLRSMPRCSSGWSP